MRNTMLQGIYIGPLAHLKGKTALLRLQEPTQVLAQFDDLKATREPELLASRPDLIWATSLGYGWHEFPATDFTLSANNCYAIQRSDSMSCKRCDLAWDMGDPSPPACRAHDTREYTMADWWHDLRGPHGNR